MNSSEREFAARLVGSRVNLSNSFRGQSGVAESEKRHKGRAQCVLQTRDLTGAVVDCVIRKNEPHSSAGGRSRVQRRQKAGDRGSTDANPPAPANRQKCHGNAARTLRNSK